MHVDRVTFPGHGGHELSARLHRTAGPPIATAVFAHCFTCGKDLRAAARIAETLAARGIAVLRFDFTGLGESAGAFADTSISTNVDDLIAAADYLRAEHQAPRLLVGHSLGGAAVLAAAARLGDVRAVATIAAPADPGHVRQLFAGDLDDIERDGQAEVSLAGRRFRLGKSFLDDLDDHALPGAAGDLDCALLFLHAPGDTIVGIDEARRLFEAARHPKSFVSLDAADHLLGRDEDARYAAEVIASWAARYVAPQVEQERLRADEGEVRCRIDGEGLLTKIAAGPHGLIADEPRAVGGSDAGPTPYGLLAASLGACTAMTLRLYADRKGWPLAGVEVSVRHERRHIEDCVDCEQPGRRIDHFDRTLLLEGELTGEQRQRLLAIAAMCPVHRTLEREARILTTLA